MRNVRPNVAFIEKDRGTTLCGEDSDDHAASPNRLYRPGSETADFGMRPRMTKEVPREDSFPPRWDDEERDAETARLGRRAARDRGDFAAAAEPVGVQSRAFPLK